MRERKRERNVQKYITSCLRDKAKKCAVNYNCFFYYYFFAQDYASSSISIALIISLLYIVNINKRIYRSFFNFK